MATGTLSAAWILPSLAAGGLAGLLGALAMDVPMGRHPEGWTPAFLTAAAVRRVSPDQIDFESASVVHHSFGVLAGAVYALLFVALSLVVPSTGLLDLPLLAHLIAVAVTGVLVYASVAHVVLPQVGASLQEQRLTAARGQWLRASVVFTAALAVGMIPLFLLLRTAFGA